jgi:cytochrome b subunit of formate dehydrogenase
MSDYESLNRHAQDLKDGKTTPGDYGAFSTGQKLYIALAASNMELLEATGYTIPHAINRLGPTWLKGLLEHWG